MTAACKLLPELKLIPGFALDPTTCDVDGKQWDFNEKEMRDRARRRVLADEPLLLVGSPMCTAFSTWQRVNNAFQDPTIVARELKAAVAHLEFCVELYRIQHKAGRYFLHEHPAHASSWQTEQIDKLAREDGILRVTCDQCQYGCESEKGAPIMKPTSFLTNAP